MKTLLIILFALMSFDVYCKEDKELNKCVKEGERLIKKLLKKSSTKRNQLILKHSQYSFLKVAYLLHSLKKKDSDGLKKELGEKSKQIDKKERNNLNKIYKAIREDEIAKLKNEKLFKTLSVYSETLDNKDHHLHESEYYVFKQYIDFEETDNAELTKDQAKIAPIYLSTLQLLKESDDDFLDKLPDGIKQAQEELETAQEEFLSHIKAELLKVKGKCNAIWQAMNNQKLDQKQCESIDPIIKPFQKNQFELLSNLLKKAGSSKKTEKLTWKPKIPIKLDNNTKANRNTTASNGKGEEKGKDKDTAEDEKEEDEEDKRISEKYKLKHKKTSKSDKTKVNTILKFNGKKVKTSDILDHGTLHWSYNCTSDSREKRVKAKQDDEDTDDEEFRVGNDECKKEGVTSLSFNEATYKIRGVIKFKPKEGIGRSLSKFKIDRSKICDVNVFFKTICRVGTISLDEVENFFNRSQNALYASFQPFTPDPSSLKYWVTSGDQPGFY